MPGRETVALEDAAELLGWLIFQMCAFAYIRYLCAIIEESVLLQTEWSVRRLSWIESRENRSLYPRRSNIDFPSGHTRAADNTRAIKPLGNTPSGIYLCAHNSNSNSRLYYYPALRMRESGDRQNSFKHTQYLLILLQKPT